MAMKWIALASVLCLALGDDVKGQEEQETLLAARCCLEENALPSLYTDKDLHKCYDGTETIGDENNEVTEAQKCTLLECILDKKGLLNNKSVKEKELKEAMYQSAHPDAQPIVKAALDKCFEEFAKNPDKDKCERGLLKLVTCTARDVLKNCPKTMWNREIPECQSKDRIE